jgi:diguanylate cyclase (GGDEF)-like protein
LDRGGRVRIDLAGLYGALNVPARAAPDPTPGATDRLDPADLSRLSVLQGVDLPSVVSLLERCTMRTLEPGEELLRAGEPNQVLYLVLSGRLAVNLGREPDPSSGGRVSLPADTVALVEAGDSVGELSVIDDRPASATVAATESTRLLAVDEEVFWGLVTASHAFALNLLLVLARRMRASNSTITESLRLRRRFERFAMFDGLTGVYNRRWLDETLPRLVSRHARDGVPLTLLALDIDHFKRVNDEHGHPAGDQILVAVARAVTKGLRPTDLVARYGGEEIFVILPGTDEERGKCAAERLRAAVGETTVVAPDGEILPRVTVSIGVAALGTGQSAADLVAAADAALYRAKGDGRNRVAT